MIDLSPFPQSVRSALRLLWGAGVLGLAVLTAGALVGYGSPTPDVVKALFVCLILVSAALCGLRAVLVREERVTWTVFAVGMASWAAGYGNYFLVVEDLASAPYPSLSDALWMVYYVGTIVGLLALMRSRQQHFRRSVWLDAFVGGLAIAAVAAELLVDPILVATGGSLKAVATNMAYPLFNVLIISIVLAVFALSGWRPGRGWILLGGVFAAQLVADMIYLFQAAAGTYQFGTLLDAVYPGFMLAVAVAAWQKPAVTRGTERQGWGSLAVTAGFAVVALGFMTYDHWHPVNDVALVLLTLTLLAAFVRTAMTFGDMRSAVRGRELLERNELILNAAGEGICGLDADGVITFVNPQAAALTGFAPVELVGRALHPTVHHTKPDGSPYPLAECPVTRSLRDARVHHADDQMFWRKDGSNFPVGFTSTPVLAGDRVTGAVVVFRDITVRMATEAALRASELRTREILKAAHDAFVAMSEDGRIIDWNPTAEAIFGWSRDEAVGRELSDTIIPEAHRDAHRRGLQHFLATGESPLLSRRVELSALHRDGHEFEVETTISPLLTEDGWTFNAFARDITERNAAQEQLRRQRQLLLEAQSVGGFGTWDYDVVANTTEWSDELCRIYGVEYRDRPRTIEQAIEPTHPEDVALVAAALQGSLDDGSTVRMKYRIVRPDGSVRTVEACGEAVTDEQGVVRRMLGTAQDITERYAVQQAKDEFVSVVSHELRTPLTSIRGSLGLLESGVLGPLAEQGQRMVEIAVQNTDRLVRLINDILDIERLDAGENDVQPVSCAAGELIEQACSAVAALAEAAQVTVTTHVEPVDLQADGDRVVQTLTNLIGNAVKFSSAGQVIRVSCSRRDEEVLFEVSDQGRGIPPEHLELIFERFHQVDVSDARQKGGTGLGLAICRSIVEQHGGRIWAHSACGEGATFSFVLPSPTAHGHDPRPARSARSGGPTVLVCDDDPGVLEVVGAMLEARGFGVVTANSGEQALELAVAEPPDAILLDLLMSGMSGWETAAALERHPGTRDVPIVILSVLAPEETDRPEGTVVDWVLKPLGDVELFMALERAIGSRTEPFKVLVVEDDPDLVGVMTATFRRRGIQTFHAPNGAEAITISQRVMPDLLVLDLGLPEVDGFQVVDWLRRHERLSSVPMVIYTARELDESDRERLRLGATTELLTKGRITPEHFEQRVMALLGRLTPTDRQESGSEPEAHPVGR